MAIDPLDIEKTMASGAGQGGYTLSSGDTLGQYRIISPLGRGGMGEVYEVEHTTLARRYALKLLPSDFATQQGALDRFRREAKVMANLDHPNILKVDDFGEANGRYWLRMELARGSGERSEIGGRCISLQDLADARGGRLPQDELAGILDQILSGLQYAHSKGAVHRDIKPANILFCDGVAKIADFGLVRLVGEDWVRSQAQLSVQRSLSVGDMQTIGGSGSSKQGSSTRSMLGTFEYMSPEQKRGEDATAQSDLYSIGLMAFKLLTGQNPGLKPPSRIDSMLSKDWDELLERALEECFADRWPDAAAMLASLAGLSGAISDDGQIVEVPPKETKPVSIVSQKKVPTVPEKAVVETRREPVRNDVAVPVAGQPRTVDLGNNVTLDLVWIPPGSFMMGSRPNEEGRQTNEQQHRVTLSKGFWMAKYEVSQEQWQAVMGNNLSRFKRARNPVEQVSWDDCQEFIKKLNQRSEFGDQMTGGTFHLPTEAEWEYACRAGTTGAYAGNLDEMGWYESNSGDKTHPVGGKKPNEWGLYDMHGNVWEWCEDRFDFYSSWPETDPTGSLARSSRVRRGGSWNYPARFCRSALRFGDAPGYSSYDVGFRVVVR